MFHDDDDKKVSGENMKEGLGINNLLCDIVKVHFLHDPPMPVPFGNISFLAKLVALHSTPVSHSVGGWVVVSN